MSLRTALTLPALLVSTLLSGDAAAATTPCGGLNQRACCVFDASFRCQPWYYQQPGCGGDCTCNDPNFSSAGTCVLASPCGGVGQRVCWAIEGAGPECQSGLTPVDGCTGDCFIKDPDGLGRRSQRTCADLRSEAMTLNDPETGFRNSQTPSCSMRGYADMHVHMFSHLGNGGALLAGKPYDPSPQGINAALRPDYSTADNITEIDGDPMPGHVCPWYLPACDARLWHGDHTVADIPAGVGTGDTPPSNFGAPLFIGWPHWTSTVHQQVYHKWLQRAWHGGLSMMTMLAVSNEALCKSSRRQAGQNCDQQMEFIGSPGTNPTANPIDQQLDAAYAFQAWLDARYGGPGKGWFRIVKTPLEARQAILRGKLAVVLGIEVDNLFDCREKTGTWHGINHPTCDAASVKLAVQHYYDKGVRHVFPIHNFDNAFGAAATWSDAIAVGNAVSEDRWYEDENCRAAGYGFWLDRGSISAMLAFGFQTYWWPTGSIPPIPWIPAYPNGNSPNPLRASCNARGLQSTLGPVLLAELMKHGMLIDIDHMSVKSIDQTLDLAAAQSYPLTASHVLPFDLHNQEYSNGNEGRHERLRTRAHLERIRDGGGMVALMMKDDVQDTGLRGHKVTQGWGGKVVDDCRHSSKSWAQSYQYLSEVMGNAIALGSDFNGVAGHLGPRFGSEGCGGTDQGLVPGSVVQRERSKQLRFSSRVPYPFTIPGFGDFLHQYTGPKEWDYNVNGLAHIGLYPDFIADLGVIGLSPTDLEPLFKSAEQYIKVWERAVFAGTGHAPANTDHPCEPIITCSSTGTVWSPGQFLDPDVVLTQSPPGPYPVGTTSVTVTATSPNGCAPPVSCTTTVTVIDKFTPYCILLSKK